MTGLSLLTRGYISPFGNGSQVVLLTSEEAQNILVKTLELPLPPEMTQVKGIHQSDVIIRTAIRAAFADMRANPWLLDYVFANLPQDALTFKEYGEQSVARAKEWFMKTDISVTMTPNINELKLPCVTITLIDSNEAENTLGDIHYEASEDNDNVWPALTVPLNPVSYTPSTGTLVFAELPTDLYLAVGMFVVDYVGKPHEIIEVINEGTVKISPETVADFRNSVIKSSRPALATSIESASYRETYRIGVHAGGEPVYLTWLHSIVVFALLRYRQALLEARGFERSFINSSDFARDMQHETELVFSRYITLSGFVRQYWPKAISTKIDAVVTGIQVSGVQVSGQNADVEMDGAAEPDLDSQLWVGNLDKQDPSKRK